ncbi:hypothetical protein BDZ97DRAFT_1923016 [Flammula alnicola]|nr:hypothetical protein BDZ97DRAFT_1923016 [Flammula alnicola]
MSEPPTSSTVFLYSGSPTPAPSNPNSTSLHDWIGKEKAYKDVPTFVSQELLRRVALSDVEQAFLPSKTLPISSLLAIKFTQVQTLTLVLPASCFSEKEPNTLLNALLEWPLPSREYVNKLRDLAGQAMLDGKNSIKEWTRKDKQIYLPFSSLTFWSLLHDALAAKISWERGLGWVKQQKIPPTLATRVEAVINRVPWTGSVTSLGGFLSSITDMALFLSREMLSDSHVDLMLARLAVRVSKSHPDKDSIIIAQTEFGQALSGIPKYKSAYPQGAPDCLIKKASQLRGSTTPIWIWSIGHSPPLHYGAYFVEKSAGALNVNWGDPIKRPQPAKITNGLKKWVSCHFPGSRVSFSEDLKCASQNDNYSCSIIGINTLKNGLFGDPLWSPKQRDVLRITEFLDIMEYHAGKLNFRLVHGKLVATIQTSISTMEMENPFSNGSLSSNSPTDSDSGIEEISHLQSGDSTVKISESSKENQLEFQTIAYSNKPASTTATVSPLSDLNVKGAIPVHGLKRTASAASLAADSEPSSMLSPPKKKRAAPSLPPGDKSLSPETVSKALAPKSSKINKSSVNKSSKVSKTSVTNDGEEKKQGRTMTLKSSLNEAVRTGSFQWNPTQLENYKSKLQILDPHFEIDETNPTLARLVRHSKCSENITMSMPYDTGRFKQHLQSCKGKKNTSAAANTRTLDFMFSSSRQPGIVKAPGKFKASFSSKVIKLWPCPGLRAVDDERITQYLERTESGSGGGISERILAEEMFGKQYSMLDSSQKEAVTLKQLQTHRWRLDHPRKRIFAIGEKKCLENVEGENGDHTTVKPCTECKALLSIQAFRTAIVKHVPENKNRQFVPHRYQNAAIGDMHVRNRGLGNLLSEESEDNIFLRFARQFAQGKFEKDNVFIDMIKVMVARVEREERGRGMQNMQYPPAFDEWCHELLCIRPEAYRSFQLAFGGRTERSFLQIRSSKPSFMQGIGAQTLERARQYLKDYGYPSDGPLATGVDDTKLLACFRPYYDGSQKKWFMVGGTGEPMLVADIERLQAQIDEAKDLQATKLRLWTMSIPLPRIPPLILAASPISSKNNAIQLAKMEESLLQLLIHSNQKFNVISLGSDGTSVEREARRELIRSQVAQPVHYHIQHPAPGSSPIIIELLKIGEQIMVSIQDSKHLRKTMRNNAFTGAKSPVLGRFLICYQQVCDIALATDSPIYVRDVKKLDRQDDRAAARLFSASTLDFLVQHNSDNLGLIAYLFVFGDMVDAYQSRTISHLDRVKLVLRAKFFKEMWKSFLSDAEYNMNRHFISHEADDIMDIVINGYMGLIYIHRDFLESRFPLLPWMHGTETNEHVFGFLRGMIADFSMLDVLRLVPKLGVRLMAACKRKSSKVDFKKCAAGYSHTYSDADDADLHFLSLFPTDTEIASTTKDAYEEALMIWELLGYDPTSNVGGLVSRSQAMASKDTDDEISDDEEEEDIDEQVSDRQELQNALDATAAVQAKGLPSNQTDDALDECGYAVASLNIADLDKIEKLPENDPEALDEIKKALSHILATISAQGAQGAAAVDELLRSAAGQTSNQDIPMDMDSGSAPSSTPTLNIERTDLSQLVAMRYNNQSRESAESTRTKGSELTGEAKPGAKPPTERQLLARKIYEVLRLDAEQGSSTGLNRRVRHTTAATGADNILTGNAANAQAAARTGAAAVVARRRKEFLNIELGADLATAKVDLISKLACGVYGIVFVENELMIGKVLTLYERGGGKTAKHGLVSESSSVGSVSYLPIQIWQHHRQQRFRAACGATRKLNLPRYAHLPAAAFLYFIPDGSIKVLEEGAMIELAAKFFDEIYIKLFRQKVKITLAVKKLLVTRKKKNTDEDEDDLSAKRTYDDDV